jgi:uncharacterized protein
MDAVEFIMSLDGIDATRIAVWGDSLSGGIACLAATLDERIGAVMVQVPAFGEKAPPADPDGEPFQALRAAVLSPEILGFCRPLEGPMPVASADQVRHPSALKPQANGKVT